ncbi:MFS transporter [Chloroflexota bacterium]
MPQKGKHPRVFYGWWIVGSAFFMSLYIGGVIYYGFTAFLEPIATETGWSYTQISFGASLRGFEVGIFAPLIGILADRWGPRRIMFCGVIINAWGLFLVGSAQSLPVFYIGFALIALGMSATTVTLLHLTIANWFRKKVGLAIGIATSGFGFGGLLLPLIVRLIDAYNWSMTLFILSVGMIILGLPLSLLFRHKPEQYGYFPDGLEPESVKHSNYKGFSQIVEVDIAVKQAVRSSAFWLIISAYMFNYVVLYAVLTHLMPYLSSIGIDRSTSSLVATAAALISSSGRFGLGWIADRLDKRYVAAAAFAMMSCGLLFFSYVSPEASWLLLPFLVFWGIGYGGNLVLSATLIREYFGRSNFGTILGLRTFTGALGVMAGPILAGLAYDNWGSYQGVWYLSIGLSVVALILVLRIPRHIRTLPDNMAEATR